MALAIITGASSGIGREFALKMKEMGLADEFWLIARGEEKLRETALQLSCPVKIISADLSTEMGINVYKKALEEEKPKVSFLVNAAGFGVFGAFDVLDDSIAAGMIDLNVKATVLITHNTVPHMVKGGRIIQLGSGSCFTPLPHFNVYAASKSFVLHYTKALCYELKPYGVKATCFCPGWVGTAFLGKSKSNTGAMVPKKFSPVLKVDKVVRGCLKASIKGRRMYVVGLYTKFQHLMFKLLPDRLLSFLWCKMLKKSEG